MSPTVSGDVIATPVEYYWTLILFLCEIALCSPNIPKKEIRSEFVTYLEVMPMKQSTVVNSWFKAVKRNPFLDS